jgi:hypothetical protein
MRIFLINDQRITKIRKDACKNIEGNDLNGDAHIQFEVNNSRYL